jgi:hypothetical protein
MSISDTARIDALFKKLQARTNTGINTSIVNESTSVTRVYSPQVGLQNVPLTQPSDADISLYYQWITKRSSITYNTLVSTNTVAGYRAYSDSRIKNIIPYYTITVSIAGAGLTSDQYILDFDTGVIVVYTSLAGAPTITCYTYTGAFVETTGPIVDGSGNLVVGKYAVSDANSNRLVFGGTNGDAALAPAPKTQIVERIYQAGTEKSELLLWKGDDAAGSFGPDRIRLKASELRFQNSTGASADVTAEGTNMMVIDNTGVQVLSNLTVGTSGVSGTNSNQLIFAGTAGDAATSRIVERIYGGSQNSELLIWKGDDAAGLFGPDRIRLKASELRFQNSSGAPGDVTAEGTDMMVIDSTGVRTLSPLTGHPSITTVESKSLSLYIDVSAGRTAGSTATLIGTQTGNKFWIFYSSGTTPSTTADVILIAPMFGAGFYEIDWSNNWWGGNLRMESGLFAVWGVSNTTPDGSKQYSMKRLRSTVVGAGIWLGAKSAQSDVGNKVGDSIAGDPAAQLTFGFFIGALVVGSQYNFRIRFTSAPFY